LSDLVDQLNYSHRAAFDDLPMSANAGRTFLEHLMIALLAALAIGLAMYLFVRKVSRPRRVSQWSLPAARN
jgi:hypothetical protein